MTRVILVGPTMITDGVKLKNKGKDVKVLDLAELVARASDL